VDAKIQFTYGAKRDSYGKGAASLTLRNTNHVITSEFSHYAVVLERIRLNFDDLRRSVLINPGMTTISQIQEKVLNSSEGYPSHSILYMQIASTLIGNELLDDDREKLAVHYEKTIWN
jgi:hypothetical protein